jgi:hypothetical protein
MKDDELAAEISAIEQRLHRDAVESRMAVIDASRRCYTHLHSGAKVRARTLSESAEHQ